MENKSSILRGTAILEIGNMHGLRLEDLLSPRSFDYKYFATEVSWAKYWWWLFSCLVVSDSRTPMTLDCSTPGFPVLSGVSSNSHPLSRWCHPTISSSVVPFSSCSQSFGIRVFSNESALHIRWLKYWSFSFNISPSSENIQGWFPLWFGNFGLISLLSKGLSRVFSSTTIQRHQFFDFQPSWLFSSHIHTRLLKKQ